MKIGSFVLAAALALPAAPVLAHGGHCGGGGGALKAEIPSLFAQADADGDGTLSPDEFKTFKQLVAQKRTELEFQRLDANGDGKVTLDEMNARMAEWQARKQAHKQAHAR